MKFFEIITKGVVKITGSSHTPPPITEEEIKGVIDQGLAEKALEKEEMELVHGALNFDDTVIRSGIIILTGIVIASKTDVIVFLSGVRPSSCKDEHNSILTDLYGAEALVPTTTTMHIGEFGTFIDVLTGLDQKILDKYDKSK